MSVCQTQVHSIVIIVSVIEYRFAHCWAVCRILFLSRWLGISFYMAFSLQLISKNVNIF